MQNLILDIGNTQTKLALFDSETLIDKYVCPHIDGFVNQEAVLTWIDNKDINATIVSSTLDLSEAWIKSMQGIFSQLIVLSHQTPLPIQINYDTPETLGVDRIAAAVGANYHFPNQNVVVVDLGTCMTFEVVSQENVYEGGFILPGWNMQLKAMHHFTDKLPLWSNDLNKTGEFEIGKSTESAMTEGVVHSISSTIDGLIDKIENKIGEATVILTGGDAESFETRLKSKIFVHPNLVLEGLNKILSYNVDQN